MKSSRLPHHLQTARGGVQAAIDGVHGVVGIVEAMHQRIASVAPPIGPWREARTRGITGFVYASVRGTTNLVGKSLGVVLSGAQAMLPAAGGEVAASEAEELALSALNGVVGDHLHRSSNPLAIQMQLRPARALQPHLLLVVHGLCMSNQQWTRDGHNHAEALSGALACTPVYARYNTGRHVADNGAELAAAVEQLVSESPLPIERITVIAHSMGGLVTRAALHAAAVRKDGWVKLARDVVFLGTPHFGAPLERAGNRLHGVLGVSPYLAPFGRLAAMRSDGIMDLRDGLAPHVPAPARGIRFHAVAGSIGPGIVGDGLVTVDSAFGIPLQGSRGLRIPSTRRWLAEGVGHLDLLSDRGVYRKLRHWLSRDARPQSCGASAPR